MLKKNNNLEERLSHLNDLLHQLELIELNGETSTDFPTLFIIGSPRTGSTLFTQWLASLGTFAYPSNFLSRLYNAPYVGALIYEIVTNPKYQYGDEFSDIMDIDVEHKFKSNRGKTKGFKSPHEFWYFWKRFYEFPIEVSSEEDFALKFDSDTFQKELSLMQQAFGKPLFMKGKIINYYLESFSKKIDNALYIHLRRDPIAASRSLLKAKKQKGSWFSWKPRQYNLLKEMGEPHQAVGQIYFIEKEILDKRKYLGDRYLSFNYEDFCENPDVVYEEIKNKVSKYSVNLELPDYDGPEYFLQSNPISKEDDFLIEAYKQFEEKYGVLK